MFVFGFNVTLTVCGQFLYFPKTLENVQLHPSGIKKWECDEGRPVGPSGLGKQGGGFQDGGAGQGFTHFWVLPNLRCWFSAVSRANQKLTAGLRRASHNAPIFRLQ